MDIFKGQDFLELSDRFKTDTDCARNTYLRLYSLRLSIAENAGIQSGKRIRVILGFVINAAISNR
jgi:hypothetical protein